MAARLHRRQRVTTHSLKSRDLHRLQTEADRLHQRGRDPLFCEPQLSMLRPKPCCLHCSQSQPAQLTLARPQHQLELAQLLLRLQHQREAARRTLMRQPHRCQL